MLARVDGFQRRRAWAGFPLAVARHFGESGAGRLAATISYYGFFSMFPLLLVLVTVAAIVLEDSPRLRDQILDSALAQFPVIGTDIRSNIGSLTGSVVTLVAGLGTALWAGLGAIRSTQVALDSVWDVPVVRRPSAPVAILRSFLLLVSLGIFVLATALLASVTGGAGSPDPAGIAAGIGSAALNIAIFAVTYRVLSSADVGWREVWPGAVVAGLGWTVLLLFGGWIVSSQVSSASDTYGVFAVVIGLLAWLHLGAQLTLVGAELNVVRSERLWPRGFDRDDPTPADLEVLTRLTREQRRREDQIVDVRFEGEGNDVNGQGPPHAQRATGPPPWADEHGRRPLAEVIRSVLEGLSSMFRKEVELAKIEMTEAVSSRAKGIGMMAAAGVTVVFAVAFLAAAGSAALDLVMPTWAARLIVAAVFIMIGVGLFFAGRRSMNATSVTPKRTQETLKEDVKWAKQQIRR